jgi:hypothetical protein
MGWVGAWFNRVLGAWVGGAPASEDRPRRGGASGPSRAKPRFQMDAHAERLRRQQTDDDAVVMAVIAAFLAVEGG